MEKHVSSTTKSYNTALYPFESKWTNIQGNRIHYIDEGLGEILLFCHPPVSSSFMYREMIQVLRLHYRCIAIDFPGFGLSEMSSAYTHSINSQAGILEGFIHKLGLTSITLLMQEIGGHAAMQVFISRPQLLKAIIMTDTIIFPVSQYPKIKSMLSFVNGSLFKFLNINFNFLIRAMTRFGIRKRRLSKEVRTEYKKLFSDKEIRGVMSTLLYELVKQEALLKEIQTSFETVFNRLPALLIYGEQDPLTKLGIPIRVHRLLPNSELHFIKREAHFPHEGAPGELASLIIQFRR